MLKMSHMCLPKQYLLTIYYTFLQSYLQYGLEFWASTYTTYLQPLRILQKGSIRLICHVDILTHCAPLAYNLGLLLLDDLFFYSTACIMFKVANNLSPDVMCHLFTKLPNVLSHATRSSSNQFFVPQCSFSSRSNFITYQGVICWNSLPSNIANSQSFGKFKRLLVLISAKYLL